jgi:hypothetical protein
MFCLLILVGSLLLRVGFGKLVPRMLFGKLLRRLRSAPSFVGPRSERLSWILLLSLNKLFSRLVV